MRHYHIIITRGSTLPIASVVYQTYEDSLFYYVGLAHTFFGHLKSENKALEIEYARAATEGGEAEATVVGSSALALYWMKCEDECISYTWN